MQQDERAVAVDIIDWLRENIDGEPFVEGAELAEDAPEVLVSFSDGTHFQITVAQV